MASYVDRYLLQRARRGTDVLGRPLPETDAGMMELRKQQTAQQLQDAELLSKQSELFTKNQPTRTLVQVPHSGGGTISAIQVYDPVTRKTTYEPFSSLNLLGGILKGNTSQTNRLNGVMQRQQGQGPTLDEQLTQRGFVVPPRDQSKAELITLANGDQGFKVTGKDQNGNETLKVFDSNRRLIFDSTDLSNQNMTQTPVTAQPKQVTTDGTSTDVRQSQQSDAVNPLQKGEEKTNKIKEAEAAATFLGLEGEERNEFIAQQLVGDTQTPQDKIDWNLETLDIVLDMLDTTGVGQGLNRAVGPIEGSIFSPTFMGTTANFELAHNQLKSRLSKDYFGVMKGVLSDNDIKLLLNIGTGRLSLEGTEGNYIQQLETIKNKLIKGLEKQGVEIPTRPDAIYHNVNKQQGQKVTTGRGKSYMVKEKQTKGNE